MSDEELIARLRQDDTDFWHCEAADRIEALVKREAKLSMLLDAAGSVADIQKQRAERLETALRWYSDDPSSQGDVARAALKGADHE